MKKNVLIYIILITILLIAIVGSTVWYIIVTNDIKDNNVEIVYANSEVNNIEIVYENKEVNNTEISYTNNETNSSKTSDDNETYSDLYDKAKKIGNKYGVVIEIAENVPDYALYGTSTRLYDEEKINLSLDEIDNILALYPDGFFEQLMYDNYQELRIYIIGFCSIGMGVADYNDNFNFIVMDAEDVGLIEAFSYNLNHEMAHVIDRKLTYVSEMEEGHLFSEEKWNELNPEGFFYTYGESDELTCNIYSEFSSYFSYSYGAENALEDRATIFGTYMDAYMTNKDDLKNILQKGAMKKLDYYCECIRDAFDCTGWPEKTPWEYR